jgi:hypothetical protein
MVDHLQVIHTMVACGIHHHGPHDHGHSSTIHTKKPAQSQQKIGRAVVVGATIMDQAVQDNGPVQ